MPAKGITQLSPRVAPSRCGAPAPAAKASADPAIRKDKTVIRTPPQGILLNTEKPTILYSPLYILLFTPPQVYTSRQSSETLGAWSFPRTPGARNASDPARTSFRKHCRPLIFEEKCAVTQIVRLQRRASRASQQLHSGAALPEGPGLAVPQPAFFRTRKCDACMVTTARTRAP